MVDTALEAGPALDLAVLVTLAAGHTADLEHAGTGSASALTSGYGFAFTVAAAVCALFLMRPRSPESRV
ncbi:hypothetical protein [Streptomyces shenzhenensis]|uniref:hypothetical protein n=1 Tax=Streptomyces shenzhenensis TaxID=943815 RepID=UPI001F278FB7|nr:hypothetical protein [Streptomyces shenzhenensis]